MDLLLFLELVLVIIIGARHIIKLHALESKGLTIKQVALEKAGRIMAVLGSTSALLVPRLLGVRYRLDDTSGLVYFAVTTLSFCVFIIGIQFQLAAFKEQEETPQWIKQIVNFWQ